MPPNLECFLADQPLNLSSEVVIGVPHKRFIKSTAIATKYLANVEL